ncbi:MAG: tetratricopeptide repeat protein [Firmicutes bacterium]|nr:tetratricopeptide repeat protein [Bacillota bacterium]
MKYDNNDYMRVATTVPELKDKIHINITDPNEKIYWYIQFNLKLDEASVTKKTTTITDTQGYILKTDIGYNSRRGMIVISPLEDYEQNVYYILTVSKKVRSEGYQNLKRDVHILFKIKNQEISEFKILPPNVKVPKPKKRPRKPPVSKVYSFQKTELDDSPKDSLQWGDIMINPLLAAIGMILMIVSFFIEIRIVVWICAAIAIAGMGHIIYQISRKEFRSNFVYNIGVRHFNKDNFRKAEKYFDKALSINPENEYAEYAKGKIRYYL